MRVAPEIVLTSEERAELMKLVRSKLTSVRLAQRARIVLLAAQGLQNKQIAAQLGVGRVQVSRWRERYAQRRLAGIERDLPRGAPPVKVDAARLVHLTTRSKPAAATHWSTRTMAAKLGVSAASVSRHWRKHGLKPHVVRGFKVSRDPKFVEKLEDIVGLYLSPPEHALVLCCDEKSQVQALDRTQPGLPLKKGRAATMTHDYKRNGTTTLFAALNGQVIAQCHPRHRHTEWLRFLRKIDRETPKDKALHLIVDNYATHKHPNVQKWLAKHPRFHMHFTPTSASWLNMVERFFRDLTDKRLRRGVFTSVPELIAAIDEYIVAPQHSSQAVHLDQERSRHPAEGHSRQQPLKFQTECSTALAAPISELDLVFPTGAGKIENASNFLNRGLLPALRRAGIRRIDVHSLRHAHASLMIAADVNLKALQSSMGHSSFRVTMDTYAHLVPGMREVAVNRGRDRSLSARTERIKW